MIPLTEERKQQIIDEQPDGLWLVLNEEYPQGEASVTGCLAWSQNQFRLNEPPSAASHFSPQGGIDRDRLNAIFPDTHERAVMLDRSVAEQPN